MCDAFIPVFLSYRNTLSLFLSNSLAKKSRVCEKKSFPNTSSEPKMKRRDFSTHCPVVLLYYFPFPRAGLDQAG